MSQSVERVRRALAELGVEAKISHYPQGTRTAADAAAAIGVALGSIVKSLVFTASGQPVLALVAGDQRADETKLARLFDVPEHELQFADADTVREATGFAIGGVPPVGHARELPTVIDESLGRFEVVHAAAGTPRANFPIAFAQLVEIAGGRVVDIVAD
jgi:prolyl-tRNA editing enzyme YbaK/EbsC (Cys-tRNA(Pro) deacylase)